MYFLFLLSVSVAATPWWEMYFSFSTLILLHLPFYLNSVRNFLLNSSSLSFPVSFILSLHNFFFYSHTLTTMPLVAAVNDEFFSRSYDKFNLHMCIRRAWGVLCMVWWRDSRVCELFFIECMQWKRISELRSSFRLNIRLYCCPY